MTWILTIILSVLAAYSINTVNNFVSTLVVEAILLGFATYVLQGSFASHRAKRAIASILLVIVLLVAFITPILSIYGYFIVNPDFYPKSNINKLFWCFMFDFVLCVLAFLLIRRFGDILNTTLICCVLIPVFATLFYLFL
jgi:hypothetical protein